MARLHHREATGRQVDSIPLRVFGRYSQLEVAGDAVGRNKAMLPVVRHAASWSWFVRSVAVDAPAHRQIFCLSHALHALHRPVTSLTGLARSNVDAVIEVDEVWKLMNAHPRNRARCRRIRSYRLLATYLPTGIVVELLKFGRDRLTRFFTGRFRALLLN